MPVLVLVLLMLGACIPGNPNGSPDPDQYDRTCAVDADCVLLPFKRCPGSCQCRSGFAINTRDEARAASDAQQLLCGPPDPRAFCSQEKVDAQCGAQSSQELAMCKNGLCVDRQSCEAMDCTD